MKSIFISVFRGKWKGLVVGLAAVLLVTGCQSVPVTGRSQLNLMSPSEEAQLGLASFNEMKQEVPVSQDASANALVSEVGRKIAAVADLPNANWEFVVFDSPEANAFCLPGGKVGVYTGILQVTKNEGGMATVIGHEVAHAVARHGAERMSEAMLMEAGGQILGVAASGLQPQTQALIGAAYGVGSQVGRTLPHSRAQESEADQIGLIYMARAGYDPREAVEFWKRFAAYSEQAGSGGTPWFLRTHPLDSKRIEQLQTWMPEALRAYQAASR